MTASPARIAANQNNARRSTGPKTLAGKQKSRGNALKHGLTGDGVVLPAIDVPAITALEADLTAELRPASTVGTLMVRRMAVMAVRLQRCEQHDEAMTAQRVRGAAARRVDDRRAEVEALRLLMHTNPGEAAHRLRQTPEGIDHLLAACQRLRDDLGNGEAWHYRRMAPHVELAALMGKDSDRIDDPELVSAGEIVSGRHDPYPDSPKSERQVKARDQVIARIDREMDALEDLRPRVDDAAEAADRNEAPVRALFDPSPEAERARKYEAATERGFFRALREFHKAEAALAEAAEADEPGPAEEAEPEAAAQPPAPAPVAPPVAQTNPIPAAPVSVYAGPAVHKTGDLPAAGFASRSY